MYIMSRLGQIRLLHQRSSSLLLYSTAAPPPPIPLKPTTTTVDEPHPPPLLSSTADVDTLLERVNSTAAQLRPNQACELVIALADVSSSSSSGNAGGGEWNVGRLTADPRFVKLSGHLESNTISQVEPLAIVSCLKALKELGVSSDSFTVRNLENSLTWMARSCSIKDLVMGFSFSLQRQDTDTQKMLHREILQSLERRWVEIKEGRLFVTLLHSAESFSPQFMNKLEDRISDLVEEMSPADMAAILSVLGRKRRRNLPLIRALTFHLAKNRTSLDVKQIADVLFALNKLSFKEQDTLERICSGLEGQIETMDNPAVIRSVLTSLGQLRFLPNTVVDRICDWYKVRINSEKELEPRDLSTLIISLASLNYVPYDSDQLFKAILERMKMDDFTSRGNSLWLDIVWSLVVLGKANNTHLESVLNNNFYSQLIYSAEQKSLGAKLLNINAAAEKLYPDYTGPVIDVNDDPLLKDLSLPSSLAKNKFKKFVLEAFATLFPPPRFVSLDVSTGQGWLADAEVVCDKQARPLQVGDYTTRFSQVEPAKPLPEGGQRLVLLVNSFHDCLLSGGVSGVTALTLRLARASGYTPLLVDYKDLESNMKMVTRVQKLDTLVKMQLGVKK